MTPISSPRKEAAAGRKRRLAKCIARDVGLFRGPVFGYPPAIVWDPLRFEQARKLWVQAIERRMGDPKSHPMGIFANVPFCDVLCRYCDYVTTIGTADSVISRYPDLIEREIASLDLPRVGMDSLYASGGNLAIFPPRRLDRLFNILHAGFNFTADATKKIGLSHSPISNETAQVFSDWGIRGAVIQVQTLDAELSRRIQRAVEPGGFPRTCERLRRAGISHIKVDWMVGLPEQSMASFLSDLREILGAEPDEIVVTPFHPGPYAPLWSLRHLHWRPEDRLLDPTDILAREEKVRIARQKLSEHHRRPGGRAWREIAPREERRSTLGLGYGAISHIYGLLKYTHFGDLAQDPSNADGKDAASPDVYGIAMPPEREQRRFLIERLTDHGDVNDIFFEDVFGIPPSAAAFAPELDRLLTLGYLKRTPSGVRTSVRKRVHQSIAAAMLYEPAFQSIFQDRLRLHPERYAGVDRNLLEIYGC